jgi:hypothetical protein
LQGQVDAFLQRYYFHRPHLERTPLRPPLKRIKP